MNKLRLPLGTIGVVGLLLISGMVGTRPAQADSGSVTIQNFAFNPSPLNVPVGSTVTWTNADGSAHTTTSDNGAWDSGALSNGAHFSFTFTQAGTYTYHCAIHSYMHGTIVVGSGGTQPTDTPLPTSVPVPTDTAVPTGVPTATTAATAAPSSTSAPAATAVPTNPEPTIAPSATAKPTSVPRKGKKKTVAAKPKGQTYKFSPATTTVKAGTKVTWVNDSQAEHTVTSNGKSWKFNKTLNTKSVSFTFKKAGTYLYHCQFHPGMVGKIIVKK
jgi:plastocyanin